MTPQDYRAARVTRGTQLEVARYLGVSPHTVLRRERGRMTITREAALALLSMPAQTCARNEQPTTTDTSDGQTVIPGTEAL